MERERERERKRERDRERRTSVEIDSTRLVGREGPLGERKK